MENNRTARSKQVNEAHSNTSPTRSGQMPARILVVEDDLDIQHILCVYLKHSGFEVLVASDGQEAIGVIPGFCPDLIVLDIMMRPVDGWAVLQWLQTRAQHVKPLSGSGAPISPPVPVLVLTALNHLAEQVHGFEEGAIEYMTKPTQPRVLVERIRTILGLSVEQRTMLQRRRADEQRKTLERLSAPQADEFVF